MNLKLKRSLIAGLVFCCSTSMLAPFPSVSATDNISEVENITSDLQSQLSGINSELLKISDEISSTEMQIEITNSEIMRTQDNLVAAQANESQQYESMKTRIKYMYETGNSTLIEMLFSAEDMSDFLNKADFIQNISTYDRNMLTELQATRTEIKEKKDVLEEQYTSLSDLQSSLTNKQSELQSTADATSTNLAEFQAQLQQLREAEAQKQAEEAAAKAAEEAVAKAAQEAAEESRNNQYTDSSAAADNQSDNNSSNTPAVSQPEYTPSSPSGGELDVFAAILQCEAYQDYDSLLAVATVIMNRVYDPRFPNSITGVIYASGQFEPVWSGRLNSVMASGATSLSYQVAQAAMGGARLGSVSDCYFFLYAGATSKQGVIIGNNVFFQSW